MKNFTNAESHAKHRAETVEDARKCAAVLRIERKNLTTTINGLNRLLGVVPSDVEVSTYSWDNADTFTNMLEYRATITIPIVSMKIGTLPSLLTAAMNHGFEPTGTSDATNGNQRTFTFKRERTTNAMNGATTLLTYLTIEAKVSEDEDNLCRKIQTGTKTEEVPIYKILCD